MKATIDDGIDDVCFTPLGKTDFMTWKTSLSANFTDGILIIHEGRIIARGTLEELRAQADAGEAHLEEIFLQLTAEKVATASPAERENSSESNTGIFAPPSR
mgnify:CR=1 FL=1